MINFTSLKIFIIESRFLCAIAIAFVLHANFHKIEFTQLWYAEMILFKVEKLINKIVKQLSSYTSAIECSGILSPFLVKSFWSWSLSIELSWYIGISHSFLGNSFFCLNHLNWLRSPRYSWEKPSACIKTCWISCTFIHS